MRLFLAVYASFLLLWGGSVLAAELPQMRPALIGSGRSSLINLIDTAHLMKKGQGDAIVRFSCYIFGDGECGRVVTYHRSANSDAFAEELIYECRRAHFIPAVYDSRPVSALMLGTALFVVIDGKPHLRIFLNQEPEHLKKGDDFICAQPFFRWSDNFYGFERPADPTLSGEVILKLDTDATGKLLSAQVVYQTPPNADFAKIVMARIHRVEFLPSYLHGRPIASTTSWELLFEGNHGGTYWKND